MKHIYLIVLLFTLNTGSSANNELSVGIGMLDILNGAVCFNSDENLGTTINFGYFPEIYYKFGWELNWTIEGRSKNYRFGMGPLIIVTPQDGKSFTCFTGGYGSFATKYKINETHGLLLKIDLGYINSSSFLFPYSVALRWTYTFF